MIVYVPKVPAEGKGVGTLLSNATSPIRTNVFKICMKVAATPPPFFPFDNINNYKYTYTALIFCNSGVEGNKKTPYNSIFLAVNPFDKARYKFYRRGCP